MSAESDGFKRLLAESQDDLAYARKLLEANPIEARKSIAAVEHRLAALCALVMAVERRQESRPVVLPPEPVPPPAWLAIRRTENDGPVLGVARWLEGLITAEAVAEP